MPYQITRTANGRPSIVLSGEPPYCNTLDAAPSEREPALDAGWWLVVAFAAWSMPDIAAIQTALDVAKHFGGTLQLGLRPFDHPEEHDAWCLGLEEDERSPLWLLLRDGQVRMKRQGILTVDALIGMIETAGPA